MQGRFGPLPQGVAIEAAIVDLDGTLVDTLGDFHVAINMMLRELALGEAPREAVALMVGKGSEHLLRSVLAHVGAADRHYAAAWSSYQRHYLAINGQHSAVFPGVREGLEAMRRRGLKLACLTNKPTSFTTPLLAAKGLTGLFDVVFGGDAFERRKPDPLPVERTCAALGTRPAATLVVGDSVNDALAARAAGCPVVLVTYGYNHGQPIQAVDADGYIDSLLQLAH